MHSLEIRREIYLKMTLGGRRETPGLAAGLRASGGALGVGRAVQQAVKNSILLIIVVGYIITWFFYFFL